MQFTMAAPASSWWPWWCSCRQNCDRCDTMTICSLLLLTGSRPSPCSHTADASRWPRPPARTCVTCATITMPRVTCHVTCRAARACSSRWPCPRAPSSGGCGSRGRSWCRQMSSWPCISFHLINSIIPACTDLVELLHGVEVAVEVGVPGKVRPVDPLQSAVVVVSGKQWM